MTPDGTPNLLYYGDNLDILRRYIKDESVDLIYLDPPFNSAQNYNVLFEERNGTESSAQIHAFKDTWRWDAAASAEYERTVRRGGKVAEALASLRSLLGFNDMLAYLSMMAPRLAEMHRVLRKSGSLYLHCDPTASPYLRVLLDSIFGPENFKNEIVWMRIPSKSLMKRRLPSNHDIIFAYQKSDQAFWNLNESFIPYDLDALDRKTVSKYKHRNEKGRLYRLDNLINPNKKRPNLTYEFLGMTKVWRWTKERMMAAYKAGLVIQTKPGAVPQYKRYLDEQRGKPIGDVWTDIPPINSQAKERLGYATQKPQALLERIIRLSSQERQVVLDPFCGCGTTVAAAQKLKRHWIGIDITHLAIALIRKRLTDAYGKRAKFRVVGEPISVTDAEALAIFDPFQFQCWSLGLVGARPSEPVKRGADKGIDGKMFFFDDATGKAKTILFSVKSGKTNPAHVRELTGTLEHHGAQVGVLIILHEATAAMRQAAAAAGQYHSPGFHKDYPRLQILTITDLISGRQVDMPPSNVTFKRAPKDQSSGALTPDFFDHHKE
ncbi:MAG: DNA methyltransferase [Candidatus Sumerlaeota bacterium]|nr:DNA methyltransferase [Candidatus Sumerlaeota bacterium]